MQVTGAERIVDASDWGERIVDASDWGERIEDASDCGERIVATWRTPTPPKKSKIYNK
jgi:hypothetical protein